VHPKKIGEKTIHHSIYYRVWSGKIDNFQLIDKNRYVQRKRKPGNVFFFF